MHQSGRIDVLGTTCPVGVPAGGVSPQCAPSRRAGPLAEKTYVFSGSLLVVRAALLDLVPCLALGPWLEPKQEREHFGRPRGLPKCRTNAAVSVLYPSETPPSLRPCAHVRASWPERRGPPLRPTTAGMGAERGGPTKPCGV